MMALSTVPAIATRALARSAPKTFKRSAGFGTMKQRFQLSICHDATHSLFGNRQNSIHGGLTNAELTGNTYLSGTLGGKP